MLPCGRLSLVRLIAHPEMATHRVRSMGGLGEALKHRTSFVPFMMHFNPLWQEMNKKFGDVIHLGDAIAFLHKRRPDKSAQSLIIR
jgi:hypothetical protein